MYWTETEEINRSKNLKEKAQRVEVLEQRTCRQFGEGALIKGPV